MANIRLLSQLQQQFIAVIPLPEDTLKAEPSAIRKSCPRRSWARSKDVTGYQWKGSLTGPRPAASSQDLRSAVFFFMQRMDWIGQEPTAYMGAEESGRFIQLLFRGVVEERGPFPGPSPFPSSH